MGTAGIRGGDALRDGHRRADPHAYRVLAIYSIRSQILALLHPACQRITSDRVNGQHKSRKDIIAPLQSPSLCALQAQRNTNKYPTLGFFKPGQITGLKIEQDDREWTELQKSRLRQIPLFGSAPTRELEKVPFIFKYQFTCNDSACRGHELSCTDWEMGQAYRSWVEKYPTDWEAKFRQRFEDEMINRFDTHFFVGTIHQHPNAWIIIGLFYPLKAPSTQLTLA